MRLLTPLRLPAAMWLVACNGEPAAPPKAPAPPPRAAGPAAPQRPARAAPEPAEPPAPPDAEPTEPPPPEVEGPLTRARIKEIVRARFDAMVACYEAGLARDPELAGVIEVHLAIDDEGVVVGADAPKGDEVTEADRIADPEVVGCVEEAFRAIRFPPTGRGVMNFIYPVVLRTE